jgi:dihydroflavonol-4-reductase
MGSNQSAAPQGVVLITGGSGFVGSWCAVKLLTAGFRVRATLRDLARADEIRAMIAKQVLSTDNLSFSAADLTRDGEWFSAVEGCDYVLHVASPMSHADVNGPEAIAVASDGALRVLRASADAGVKRVVMTSSAAAAAHPAPGQAKCDETKWTVLGTTLNSGFEIYTHSKTLAERAAWEFVEQLNGAMELSTILPALTQGPVLGPDYAFSVELIAQLMRGKMPEYPSPGVQMVDVRDLADLHVRAMTDQAAAGERFIATAEYVSFGQVGQILRNHFGDRLPAIPVPQSFNGVATEPQATSAKADQRLGWRPRPIAQSLIDTAESLVREGVVKAIEA